MAILDACHELDELGGGQFRHTAHLRPVAFLSNGNWASINSNFVNGDANFPHVVTAAKMLLYNAGDGLRRICPTGDPSVYFEIGAPYIKPAGTWQKVNLGSVTRTGNKLSWSIAQADFNIWHAGHFVKAEIALKGGYVPPNGQFAFPIGLNGLTRSGTDLLYNEQVVMTTNKPIVYDAANPFDIRQITMSVVNVSGQNYILFTLPSLTGMSSPVIDPTLTLQPDATAGKDVSILSTGGANKNYGVNTLLAFGHSAASGNAYRPLLQFDLSSIPSTATVSSSTLSLYATDDFCTNARTYRLYRLKRSWVEGTQNGVGTPDGATWNTYDGTNNWQTAGAAGANDTESTELGTLAMSATETLNVFKDFSLDATLIQGWISGALTNNGLRGVADTESEDQYFFASSDNATAANRPKLVTVYTVPSTFDGGGIVFRPGRRWLRGRVA